MSAEKSVLLFSPLSTTVRVHPLVVFNICDSYVRRRDTADRVIGTLLGFVLPDGTVDVRNSYAVPHDESSVQVALDVDYHQSMLSSHLKVNPKEVIVGWYSTGLGVNGGTALIHDFYSREVSSPIHLTMDTGFANGEDTIKAYVSSPLSLGNVQIAAQFQEIPIDLRMVEAERVGFDILKTTMSDNIPTDLEGMETSIRGLLALINGVYRYVDDVVEGRVARDNDIGRFIADTVASVPKLSPPAFDKLVNDSMKDHLLLLSLASATRTHLSLAEKLNSASQAVLGSPSCSLVSIEEPEAGCENDGIGTSKKNRKKEKVEKVEVVPFKAPVPVTYKKVRPPDLRNVRDVDFDWTRQDILISEVRNQGKYNFCWAISTAHCIEAYHNIGNPRNKEKASPQELANQFVSSESKRSSVLYLEKVFDWIKNNGLCKEKDCPWIGKVSQTQNNPRMRNRKPAFEIRDFSKIPLEGEKMNEEQIFPFLEIYPVVGVLFSTPELANYQKGEIYMGGTIPSNGEPAEHAVLIVGWGIKNGIPYWIVRNSYGTTWGDNGYGLILRQCGFPSKTSLFKQFIFPIV